MLGLARDAPRQRSPGRLQGLGVLAGACGGGGGRTSETTRSTSMTLAAQKQGGRARRPRHECSRTFNPMVPRSRRCQRDVSATATNGRKVGSESRPLELPRWHLTRANAQ